MAVCSLFHPLNPPRSAYFYVKMEVRDNLRGYYDLDGESKEDGVKGPHIPDLVRGELGTSDEEDEKNEATMPAPRAGCRISFHLLGIIRRDQLKWTSTVQAVQAAAYTTHLARSVRPRVTSTWSALHASRS